MTFKPTSLSDFYFPRAQQEADLQAAIHNHLPFPGHGKSGLLFYGPTGTGKTALAELVPSLMEAARQGNGHNVLPYATVTNCMAGHSATSIVNDMRRRRSNLLQLSPAGFTYEIFDEADRLSEHCLNAFKSLMSGYSDMILIMTTNDVTKFPSALKGRCHLVEMSKPPLTVMTQMAGRVAAAMGLSLTQAQLAGIAANARDLRDLGTAVSRAGMTAPVALSSAP